MASGYSAAAADRGGSVNPERASGYVHDAHTQGIGAMLKEHADLKLIIEGHTDNTGSAVTNQTLSQKRAESIVTDLTSTYGISATRLVPKGFGASKPAGKNDTPEGRQANRRVELVKM